MRTALAIIALTACADRPVQSNRTTPPPPPSAPAAAIDAAPIDAGFTGPPLTEIEARVLLAERFRAAGFRVLYDVRISEGSLDVTLDGFDPDRQVGFEYVAEPERGIDLSPQERAELSGETRRVLVIDAAPESRVSAAADAFLASVRDAPTR